MSDDGARVFVAFWAVLPTNGYQGPKGWQIQSNEIQVFEKEDEATDWLLEHESRHVERFGVDRCDIKPFKGIVLKSLSWLTANEDNQGLWWDGD